MAEIIRLPGAAFDPDAQAAKPRPTKSKYGSWGDRPRKNPKNSLSDGRKRVRATVGTKPDGSPDIRNFTGRTLEEARANRDAYLDMLKAKEAAAKEDASAPPPMRPELDPEQPLKKWAKRWDMSYNRGGERHQLSTSSIVKKICDSDLGSMPLSGIKKIDVQDFANACTYAKKGKPYSASYVSGISRTLFNIFEDAVDDEIIPMNPCKRISWKDSGVEHVRELTDFERDFVTKHWRAGLAGVGAMLMLYAGLRPDETKALNWDNVGDDEIIVCDSCYFSRSGQMVLKPGVTKTIAGQRPVPIVPQLREMFNELERRPGELVWRVSESGSTTQIAYDRAWNSFIIALKAIKFGIPRNKRGNYSGIRIDKLNEEERAEWDTLFDFLQRGLRPTYCTMIYEGGADEKLMQELMGHEEIETTLKIYTRLRKEHKQRKYSSVNDYFTELQAKQNAPEKAENSENSQVSGTGSGT